MSNARKPTKPWLSGQLRDDEVARSTDPLMEENPNQGEDMTNETVKVVHDASPDAPEDTVVTARFNRKKIAKVAGTVTAAAAFLALFGSAMKRRGKTEFIEDVNHANGTTSDETPES